jgi:hypothetical protein
LVAKLISLLFQDFERLPVAEQKCNLADGLAGAVNAVCAADFIIGGLGLITVVTSLL